MEIDILTPPSQIGSLCMFDALPDEVIVIIFHRDNVGASWMNIAMVDKRFNVLMVDTVNRYFEEIMGKCAMY